MAGSDLADFQIRSRDLSANSCWVCSSFNSAYARELQFLSPERFASGQWVIAGVDAVDVYTQLPDIIEAAETGCQSCMLLRQVIHIFLGSDAEAQAEDVEVSLTYSADKAMRVQIRRDGDNVLSARNVELFAEESMGLKHSCALLL